MRSLLSICDIKDEIPEILELATKFKEGKINEKSLEDKTLAMISKNPLQELEFLLKLE